MHKEQRPPGARPIFALRDHNGQPRRRYIGYRFPKDDKIWIYSHQDRAHQPCSLQELAGTTIWDPEAALAAATGERFSSVEDFAAWMIEEYPSLKRLFPNLSGRTGPDAGEQHAPAPGPRSRSAA